MFNLDEVVRVLLALSWCFLYFGSYLYMCRGE